MAEKDIEAIKPTRIPFFRQVFNKTGITPEVQKWDYAGSGTDEDPYMVTWIDGDPRNPMLYSGVVKWSVTMVVAIATLAVSFCASAFSGGAEEVVKFFDTSEEIFTLGLSLFVLGFAIGESIIRPHPVATRVSGYYLFCTANMIRIGPLLWGPMSELFGRQILFFITYCALTAFNAGAAGSQNIETLLILRFLAGAFGSSPLTNSGGVIADMFPARERGLAMSIFSVAPFMGPILGFVSRAQAFSPCLDVN